MLINLSNHPSSNWSEEQKRAAVEQFGEIMDIPFPTIAPEADIDAVLATANEYTDKCVELLKNENNDKSAVHIMGEMTFTYNVVRYLGHQGIDAVASTTQREVIVEANGQKTSVFRFVQFRGYSSINIDFHIQIKP
jgi:hypothetical protein